MLSRDPTFGNTMRYWNRLSKHLKLLQFINHQKIIAKGITSSTIFIYTLYYYYYLSTIVVHLIQLPKQIYRHYNARELSNTLQWAVNLQIRNQLSKAVNLCGWWKGWLANSLLLSRIVGALYTWNHHLTTYEQKDSEFIPFESNTQ